MSLHVAGAHLFATQLFDWQSLGAVHARPSQQRWQVAPPQSMSVSVPLRDRSRHVLGGGIVEQRPAGQGRRWAPNAIEIESFCVGIGFGQILRIGDHDVFGREVNAASKLGEDTAKANEILVTKSAVDACGKIKGFTFNKIDVQVAGSHENYKLNY